MEISDFQLNRMEASGLAALMVCDRIHRRLGYRMLLGQVYDDGRSFSFRTVHMATAFRNLLVARLRRELAELTVVRTLVVELQSELNKGVLVATGGWNEKETDVPEEEPPKFSAGCEGS